MKKNKYLPYVVFGVPIAIGLYFVYRAIKNSVRGKNSDASGGYTKSDDGNVIKTESGGSTVTTPKVVQYFPIKRGSKGEKVRDLQNALLALGRTEVGTPDGDFGKKTETGLKNETGKTSVDSQTELDALIKKSGNVKATKESYDSRKDLGNKLINAFNNVSNYGKAQLEVIVANTTISLYNVTTDGRTVFVKNMNVNRGYKIPDFYPFGANKARFDFNLYLNDIGWIVIQYDTNAIKENRIAVVVDPNAVQVIG